MKWTDEDLDLALRDLGEEAMPAAALAEVRGRVLEQVGKRRVRWWMWAWAPAAAAAVVLMLIWPKPVEVEAPPLVAKAPGVVEAAWVGTEKRKPAAAPDGLPRLEATEIPGLVRVATRDPNIIIYWSFDNGEGDEE